MFAFGAVYWWAAPPLLIVSVAAALAARARPRLRSLADAGALGALAVIGLQLLPVPPPVQDAISPASRAFRTQMLLEPPGGGAGWMPLSLDPARTRIALMLFGAAYAIFAAVRALASSQSRQLARWLAWIAMAAAVLGMGGRQIFGDAGIYGFWKPLESGAAPFGAIINRNHFAAWGLAAGAIVAGYLATHARRQRERTARRRALITALSDTRALWLLASIALTAAAIVFTASRSAFIGLVAAFAAVFAVSRRRLSARAIAAMAALAIVCAVSAVSFARADRLLGRLAASSDSTDLGLRAEIWRESAELARTYPAAGVGAGAFPTAMGFYQTRRDVFLNHAHNQYLELASEGGLLLLVPLALFLFGLVDAIRKGLHDDESDFVWLRTGAVAALTGLAVMSIWESPFRTPAVLMMASVAAGIAASGVRR